MQENKMQVVQVAVGDLKASEYNPRKMNKEQVENLTESIKRFGLVDPLIVNNHPERKNIVIGGHQRLTIAKELGYNTVPVVYVELDLKGEQELNLRLNKNTGSFDFDILANFDEAMLIDSGFSEDEVKFKVKGETKEGDNKKNMTFMLDPEKHAEVNAVLKAYDKDRNKALYDIITMYKADNAVKKSKISNFFGA